MGIGWTDDDIKFLTTKWLAGWDDPQIAPEIKKSTKAVAAKRVVLGLTKQYYPERPEPFGPRRGRGHGRLYTREEGMDIIRRVDAGEDIGKIAKEYGVSRRAMDCKVDRLLLAREEAAAREKDAPPSERECLRCRRMFWSTIPKSKNRRCPTCSEALTGVGSSYLTIY